MGCVSPKEEREKFPRDIQIISKSLCKISISNYINMGFLVKFPNKENNFFCLITDSNFITDEMINSNQQIYFNYNNDKINKIITLDIKERYIKRFEEAESIIIEILSKDKIQENYFLPINLDYFYDNNNLSELKNKKITLFVFNEKGRICYL